MEVVVRAAVIWCVLFLLTRAMGKRELSEMTPFELLVLVTMGDLVQQGVTQEDFSVTGATLAVTTFGLLGVGTSYAAFRWRRLRPVLEGRPSVVVRDGELLTEVLRIERFTLDELHEAARGQGIADLADIRLGVLEPDGRFSFIKRDGEQHAPTPKHAG